ncbi:MAG: hypothetical protein Q9165_007973 [Trypethelium subeluteriae]
MAFVRKQLIYTLITKRQNGSSNVSIMSGLCAFTFIIGNAIASFVGITTQAQLADLWILQYLLWLAYLVYRNWGSKSATVSVVDVHARPGAEAQALQLRVRPKRPWRVKPGQYIYLNVPDASRYGLGHFQMHPYFVAWTPDPFAAQSHELDVLVQCRQGFSGNLLRCSGEVRTVIDGPYGGKSKLKSYDKVLLLASGIGIAAYLLEVRALLQAHEDQSSRIRRITLVWLLERREQESWVHPIFRKLLETDHRSILNIMLYIPPGSATEDTGHENLPRLFRIQDDLELSWLLNKEWAAEAGNMAVSICGPPSFEQAIRRGLRCCRHSIELHEVLSSMDYAPFPPFTPPNPFAVDPLMSPFTPFNSKPSHVSASHSPHATTLSEPNVPRQRKKSQIKRKKPTRVVDTDSDEERPLMEQSVRRKRSKLRRDRAKEVAVVKRALALAREAEGTVAPGQATKGTVAQSQETEGTVAQSQETESTVQDQLMTGTNAKDPETVDGGDWPIKGISRCRLMRDGTVEFLVQWEDTWVEDWMISKEAIIEFKEGRARKSDAA